MKTFLTVFVLLAGSALLIPAGLARTGHSADKVTVTGKWHFVFDTQGGDREFDPTFQQDGEQVTGKWGTADVKGTFSDNKLTLEFPYNSEEAGPGTLKLKGMLENDQMTGDWAFSEYSGAFKATRVKDSQ